MLCPEGSVVQNDPLEKEEEQETISRMKERKVPGDGTAIAELNTYKNPKNWKKSITNFLRNQLRSTRSNDGDRPSGSKENFEEKEISPEQKWQSLGKLFRRQGEPWNKTQSQGESSSQNKRLAVKKVLSSYFGKANKALSSANEK